MSLKAGLVRKNNSILRKEFFSSIYCQNLVELLGVIPTIFLEFLTLQVIYTEPPTICWWQFRFFFPGTNSEVFSTQESLLWEAMTPIHLSVSPILGAVICPASSPLLRIQEGLLIFQSIQVSLVIRMEWGLPSSWHEEPGTGGSRLFHILSFQ